GVGASAGAVDEQAGSCRRGSARRGRLGAGAPARVMFPPRTMLDLVGRLRGRRIVIVGDLIADEYLYGKPARISREAPVLILRFTEREVRLGGGANAAHNVRALGAHAVPVGVVGDDGAAAELATLVERARSSTEALGRAAARRTPLRRGSVPRGYAAPPQQVGPPAR